MAEAYLTIDDSPSPQTEKLADFLAERAIPAILFVRGALLEQNPAAIEYAIGKGLRIGNHSYAHRPAGEMTPQAWAEDLELCDHLIEAAYRRCGAVRPAKYYRFPYIDRGDGRKLERLEQTPWAENDRTRRLQDYLHAQGFAQPFDNMPPGYPVQARDCLYTYTARDWMLSDKHRGRHAVKTLADLKRRAARDQNLQKSGHAHVILLHDQPGTGEAACALIDYLREKNMSFADF